MTEAYRKFASYLRFKEVLSDPLGHLDRAGEFDASGVRRAVWLRVFDRPRLPAEEIAAAFERVRHIADVVQSANLPTGVDCVTDDGAPAMAVDYIASQPLSGVFSRVSAEQFPIPVDNALLIAEKIAIALCATLTAEIDGERVVHGFLHPGLIFVTNDGEGLVTGFGIGESLITLVDDPSSADAIHPYLAPEVLQSGVTSRRGDVYSLGAILFQLLTGTPLPTPPEGRAEAIGTAKLAYDDEPLPTDIKALLKRALARHPEERFSSAADFKKELDRLLYGGAYSPTTFNLALFMDRLFRAEIEAEEAALARELAVDVGPYVMMPVLESEPVVDSVTGKASTPPFGKPLWIAGGVGGVAVVAAVIWLTVGRGPSTPPVPPTPTAEEIAAQRLEQEEKMRTLAEGLVAEMMAAKEEEIRQELIDRQAKIDELQRRLAESERRAQQGQMSNEDVRRRQELQQQIAAEEEAQRQREAELEVERLEAAEEAQRQAMVRQTATAAAVAEAPAAATPIATPTPPAPSATPVPTAVPTPPPTVVSRATEEIALENAFVEPGLVDTLPVVIKDAQVEWPRAALYSRRQGVVILQATVDANGVVEDLKVLRADHDGFGIPQAVMDAVMKYRFKPATKDGVRVKTYVTVTKPYRFVTR